MEPGGVWRGFRFFIVALVAATAIGAAGYAVKDRFDRATALHRARADWAIGSQVLAAELGQRQPLDLGKVWVTHSGRICGVVNGKWAGGYIPGMMPFQAMGRRVLLVRRTTELAFAAGWTECMRDDWFALVPGSKETGYCAAREMQARCVEHGA